MFWLQDMYIGDRCSDKLEPIHRRIYCQRYFWTQTFHFSNSSLIDLELRHILRPLLSMWDTTSMFKHKIFRVSHPSSLQPQLCVKSSIAMLVVSAQAWFALAGTHTKAIRSTVLTRLASSKSRKSQFPVLAVPSSMVTRMQIGNPTCLLTMAKHSLRVQFLLPATEMALLEVSSAWSTSQKPESNASSFHTKTSKSNEWLSSIATGDNLCTTWITKEI